MSQRAEGSPALLERRWFAAHNACIAQREQCDHIRQSLEQAEQAWRLAYAKLRTLETLRETLGQELAEADATRECHLHDRYRQVMSAA
jgi:flagellar biosynthesis chaperone FliJ